MVKVGKLFQQARPDMYFQIKMKRKKKDGGESSSLDNFPTSKVFYAFSLRNAAKLILYGFSITLAKTKRLTLQQ